MKSQHDKNKTMANETENKRSKASIQDYVSLGYLYLLILGIIHDVLRYGFAGINIMSYSTVLDVLLSPVVALTKSIKSILVIAIVITIIAVIHNYINKKRNKSTAKSDSKKMDFKKDPEGFLKMLAVMIMCFFLGVGLGAGGGLARQLKNKDFKLNHRLTFTNKDVLDVKLIGTRSQYIFYVKENEDKVTITPISGNILSIQKLDEPEEFAK